MKTIQRRILVAIFMLTTFINFANTDLKNVLDANKVTVVFNSAKKGHQLSIRNDRGAVLHSENVKQQGKLVKTFDFSKLENGNYTLELEKDFEIVIKTIKVENNTVIFNEDINKIIFKPFIRNEKNKVMITRITFDKMPLKVDLYYNEEIIYSETANSDTILNKVYRLDKELKGNYKVIVRNNGRSYINEFKL
ncbi:MULTISPECIES: DUF3244 domain-containing protein [unclassified Polaribacter]|uniref:DUF3244 domain-containing protein n=1 Tax=unclassified Polaribacter TaxID=196858 RepID=UPI0011BE4507|nr:MULTISPECIES: hypothetical protein [unclassified Polaribacter]TXD52452.1 hypothetical protein ES043_08660 [Polaribacter sp. IC063]TXD61090.1 hypothetical protein ES044_05930 [Polaribacter sp. IC066]